MRNRPLLAVVALLVLGMVTTAGFSTRGANAQDVELTGALVSGSCDSPGDTVGELRPLAAAEGGVLTSFTRVDVSIDDVTGDEHAVVVSLDGDVAACGDVTGSGTDVYVPVTAQGGSAYGGIAWLHARDAQTQVSLFISEGLGGSGAAPVTETVEPPDDDDDGPTPPEDDDDDTTPTPSAGDDDDDDTTPTPSAGDDDDDDTSGQTYTSPTFGYTFSYDSSWEVLEESTNPTDNGPQDFIHLFNGTSHAYFFTNAAPDDFPLDRLPDVFQSRLEGADTISNVEIREDDNGDPIVGTTPDSAFVAFTFTWTNQNNEEVELYDYYQAFRVPGQGAIVIFLNEGLDRSYDQQADARDALLGSLEIPS